MNLLMNTSETVPFPRVTPIFFKFLLNRSYLGMCSYRHPREGGDPEDFSTFPDFL